MAGAVDQGLWSLIVLTLTSLSHGQLPATPILQALISKVLGFGIVAGSTIVKLPQVLAVVRAHSADGLSPLAFELETLGLAIAATYGVIQKLAFSAYGESVVRSASIHSHACIHLTLQTQQTSHNKTNQALLIQNIALLLLIYRYQARSSTRTALLFAFLAVWGGAFSSGSLSPPLVSSLYDLQNGILLASRLPQIYQSFRARSTGQLSIITYALNTAGAAARIFTTSQEKNAGAAMLRGAVISTLLNAIMVAQIVGYGDAAQKHSSSKSGGARKKKATPTTKSKNM